MSEKSKYPARRSVRIPGYDYSQNGAYYVTLCSDRRRLIFGDVIDGEMRLNQLGMIANAEWERTRQMRKTVVLDYFVVMPNHIHGILLFLDPKGVVDYTHGRPQVAPTATLKPASVGAVIAGYKSAVTKRIRILTKDENFSVWQRSFHEHVLRTDSDLHDCR